MSDEKKIIMDMGDSELEQLTELPPTIEVDIPMYQADGKTRREDEEGRLIEGKFTLHRPTPAAAKAFAEFQRGVQKKKKIIAPSQQEVAIRALRTVIPRYRQYSDEKLLAVLVQTGGYLGDNAALANACLNILGQNFEDQEENEPAAPWAAEDVVPG